MNNDIQWRRYAIEGVVIVASILLAFGIDAWWQERQERQFEQETLIGLQQEYLDHRGVLALQKQGLDAMLRTVATLIEACESGSYESDELSLDQAIYFSRIPFTTDFGSGVRDALISSGRIEVLSNKQLRYELAEWESVLDELLDDQLLGRDFVMQLMTPYLTRNGIPLTPFSGPGFDIPNMPHSRSLTADLSAVQRLFSDPEYRSLLENRYAGLAHTMEEHDEVIAAVDSILEAIEISLAN